MSHTGPEITLLGGRVRLRRLAGGLAPTTDAVMLAAMVPAAAGDTVLDVGAGAGAASLCLAARVADCRIVGLERDRRLVTVARANARTNAMADRVAFRVGAVGGALPDGFGPFDHVLTNPPYLTAARAHRRTGVPRAAATVEGGPDLPAWLDFCLRHLRPRGTLTLIHRADRLSDVLAGLAGKAGAIVVVPLWPRPGRDAVRVLVQARNGMRTPLRLAPGLVLHGPGPAYTPEADAILRHGEPLHP